MKKCPKLVLRLTIAIIALWTIVSVVRPYLPIKFPKIDRRPKADKVHIRVINSVPIFDPNSYTPFHEVDLKGGDLSSLDLHRYEKDLRHASFDTTTIWPTAEHMPEDYIPKRILENGQNPGLDLRKLHKKGITGRDIGIAIIDSPLLVDHVEYKDRVCLYEDSMKVLGCIPLKLRAQMHGPAVASIAVGKNIGVAPEANLYFIACFPFDTGLKSIIRAIKERRRPEYDLTHYANAIYRVVDINKQLADNKKIRVLSISMGWWPGIKGEEKFKRAVNKAKDENIFVVSVSNDVFYGFSINGLGRFPSASPDVYDSYRPGWIASRRFFSSDPFFNAGLLNGLFVPMESRTIASSVGTNDYTFDRYGGESWTIPYIAGMYALAAQVDPNITPDRFWALAHKTGGIGYFKNKNVVIPFGLILNPEMLIAAIKKGELVKKEDLISELERIKDDNGLTELDLQFKNSINQKLSQLDIKSIITQDDIINVFGKPWFCHWRWHLLTTNNGAKKYFMSYHDGFRVLMIEGIVKRFEFHKQGYLYKNKIQVGSTLAEVFEVVGNPQGINDCLMNTSQDFEEGILYKGVYGNNSWSYYAPEDQKIEIYFVDNKVTTFYLVPQKTSQK